MDPLKVQKSCSTATSLLSKLAKIDKSNVAVERFFFGLLMDPLLKSDCPISIFSGLGGPGLSFFHFRAVIEHIVLTYVIFMRFSLIITPR